MGVRRRAHPTALRLTLILFFLVLALAHVALFTVAPRLTTLSHAHFMHPAVLFGLLALPIVLWRGTFGEDRRTPRLRMGSLVGLQAGPPGLRVMLRDLPGVLRTVALGLGLVALARPVDTLRPEVTEESGIDLVLALDLSGSMQAVMENIPPELRPLIVTKSPRIPPRRVDAAKAVIRDFVARRKTDRIGVVVFGKDTFVLTPPTLDYQLLDFLVSNMELGTIDGNATALGDALGAAVARLRRSASKSKAVILLTDGDNNSGKISPEYAAELAKKGSVRVFTIQIGDGNKARVYVGPSLLGEPRFVEREFPVNPELLRSLAETTSGHAYVASDAKALLASFHDVLNKLEKSRFEGTISRFHELFPYFLLPAALLLALEALLRSVVLRRFP